MAGRSTDREQVYDLMVRYGRCVDAHDHEGLIETVYTSDVVVIYEPWEGPIEPIVGVDAWREFWGDGPPNWESSHQFTNFAFEIGDDDGTYSCLALAQHWPRLAPFPAEVPLATVGLRYEVRVRRTADGWRIAEQRNVPLWCSGDMQVLTEFPGRTT